MRELDEDSPRSADRAGDQEPQWRDLEQEHVVPESGDGNDDGDESGHGSYQRELPAREGAGQDQQGPQETTRTISVAVVRASATSEPGWSTRVAA